MNSRHYPEEIKTIKALKKIIPIITAFLIVFILVSSAKAQVTGTATGTVSIITPISIAASGNLNFGNVAVSSSLGTVVLAPGGSRSLNGGVTLPAVVGPFSPATFTVTGMGSSTYSILLPSSCVISDGANHSMTINDFTSYPSGAGILSPNGTQTINVGATLNVVGAQKAGAYTNETGFPVIVNYN